MAKVPMSSVRGRLFASTSTGGRSLSIAAVLLAAVCLAFPGCSRGAVELSGQAADEWVRTYELEPGGEVALTNRGTIEVEGSDAPDVEIRAIRTVKAVNAGAARDLLSQIRISEQVTPSLIEVEMDGIEGLLIGASYEVAFRARVPRRSAVRLRAAGGDLQVSGLAGRVVAATTNGAITARGLSGGAEIRSVNGGAQVELSGVGDIVEVRATNGSVEVTLPADLDADLLATATNGTIDVSGIELATIGEQTLRRVRGRLNAGGPPLELSAVNGGVRVRAGERPGRR